MLGVLNESARKLTSIHENFVNPPVDLVQLEQSTMGDEALAVEILELFRASSHDYLGRLCCAETDKEWKLAAHTLKGSARGIGAWKVAAAVGFAEQVAMECDRYSRSKALCDVRIALAEADRFIRKII
jgi:HPt (histidine-containing phosphotransfer) domain-containing protein